jgi:hypothetical protein
MRLHDGNAFCITYQASNPSCQTTILLLLTFSMERTATSSYISQYHIVALFTLLFTSLLLKGKQVYWRKVESITYLRYVLQRHKIRIDRVADRSPRDGDDTAL